VLGRLIRGFIPVPWHADKGAVVASVFRAFVLFGTALCLLFGAWRRLPTDFTILVSGIFFVTLLTTLMFYGTPRFSVILEIVIAPYALLGWARLFTSDSSAECARSHA
jgi:hypothetical protein